MSSDAQALAALAMKTGSPMKYFDLVTIVNGQLKKRCFIGLSKHSVFFLRQNWDDQIHAGGEIPYAHVKNVIVDTNSRNHLMLSLSDNRPPEWASERLYVDSDHRDQFLRHLRCSWQTDFMWRIGKVQTMIILDRPLTSGTDLAEVAPFIGWMWKEYEDYKFMLPETYKDKSNAIQQMDTGEYEDASGSNVVVQVHELRSIDQAKCMNLDHIRWVSLAYKSNLLKDETQFYVLRNASYQKRMNLHGDIASWQGWELIIRTEAVLLIVMLLRRQYVPPVCNNVQDIAVILRCPTKHVADPMELNRKILEAHLIADSITSASSTFSIYQTVVQTKLDTLRFDDISVAWVRAYLKLVPMGECGRRQAKTLLRALLKMYIKDGAIVDQEDMLNADAIAVIVNADPEEKWSSLPDVDVITFLRDMKNVKKSGLPDEDIPPEGCDTFKSAEEKYLHARHCNVVRNRWMVRIARYLAWAVDGGMLGKRFDLEIMINGLPQLSEQSGKVARWVLGFLLHFRPRDMTVPFQDVNLNNVLKTGNFDNSLPYTREETLQYWMFNESIMMTLLRCEYIRKTVFTENKKVEYVDALGSFLRQRCGIELKSYICRLFMEGGAKSVGAETVEAVIEPLATLMNEGGAFLATYASAALVNLSYNADYVKTKLLSVGIAVACCNQLKAKDDDLVAYTLMLLVNLTKEPAHRSIMFERGVLVLLYDILTSTYSLGNCASSGMPVLPGGNTIKIKILTQVCIVIGQFCNEQVYRKKYQDLFEHTTACLVYMYMGAKPASPLATKAMFALKQVSIDSPSKKLYIVSNIGPKLVEELFNRNLEKTVDFYNQAALLLSSIANHKESCQRLVALDLNQERVERLLREETKVIPCAPDLRSRLEKLSRTLMQKDDLLDDY